MLASLMASVNQFDVALGFDDLRVVLGLVAFFVAIMAPLLGCDRRAERERAAVDDHMIPATHLDHVVTLVQRVRAEVVVTAAVPRRARVRYVHCIAKLLRLARKHSLQLTFRNGLGVGVAVRLEYGLGRAENRRAAVGVVAVFAQLEVAGRRSS